MTWHISDKWKFIDCGNCCKRLGNEYYHIDQREGFDFGNDIWACKGCYNEVIQKVHEQYKLLEDKGLDKNVIFTQNKYAYSVLIQLKL
jgi:hypothetical protein